jgi:putative DNA primase/helicase
MNATLQSWARALGGEVCGEQVLCPGPGHSAKDRSLSVTIGKDGEPIVHSFSGDDWKLCRDYVRSRLGLEPYKPNGHAKPAKETYFVYRDEAGAPIFRSVRTPEKRFWQSPADGHGGWVEPSKGCMAGVRLVPYRLPELLEALAHGRTIVIAEGEAKVDLLWSWNLPATCNSGGAGKWRAEYSRYLSGADVVILPDNDEPGRQHASTVAASLKEAGATVRVLDLPGLGPKGDVINWSAAGGTVEQLHALIKRAAEPFPNGKDEPARVVTRCASDITPETFSWLWKYWLARGKLHIIGGAPETGKTTIALSYAAIVSSGGTWPDGTRAAAGNVLIWTSEDDPADTLVPRLIRMGAELTRIYFIEETIPRGKESRPFNPATDMLVLVEKAKAIGDVALLSIDPIVATVPMTRNSHNNAEARNAMQPVVDFAKASHIAVLGIGHLTKGTAGKDPLERLNGSLAFGALPRLVMGAAKNSAIGDDEPERIMVRIKSNIGPSGGGFGYHIDAATLHERPNIEATRIVWEYPLEGTARELLAKAEGEQDGKLPKTDQAKRFLTETLANAKKTATEIEAGAQNAGISWASVRRASDEMNVHKFREEGRHWWQLT